MFLKSTKNILHRSYRIRFRLITLSIISILLLCSFSYAVTARNVYVVQDGENTYTVETYSADAASIIAKAGLALTEGDSFVETFDEDGSPFIQIIRKCPVNVYYNKSLTKFLSSATSVSGVLEELDITLGEYDSLNVDIDAPLTDGMDIIVIQPEVVYHYVTEKIPYESITRENANTSRSSLVQSGVEGESRSTYATLTYSDGIVLEESILVSTEIVKEPVDEIREIGTKVVAEPASPVPAANGSANTITTASGDVVSYSKVLTCTATAYTIASSSSITATGTQARYGAIAVDPKVIPYGTQMYILAADGSWVYGYAVAEDCGGAIKGNKIDLFFDTYDECIQFGRQTATVYILG